VDKPGFTFPDPTLRHLAGPLESPGLLASIRALLARAARWPGSTVFVLYPQAGRLEEHSLMMNSTLY